MSHPSQHGRRYMNRYIAIGAVLYYSNRKVRVLGLAFALDKHIAQVAFLPGTDERKWVNVSELKEEQQ
jgi:hypothetical protein